MAPVDFSFPRSARLLHRAEFSRVFHKPEVSSDRYFKVLARYNEGQCSRLGMAVSRQVDKRATVRNRIKRVIRESFRQRVTTSARAVDMVVLPRRACVTTCNEELFRSLEGHWSHLERRLKDRNT